VSDLIADLEWLIRRWAPSGSKSSLSWILSGSRGRA